MHKQNLNAHTQNKWLYRYILKCYGQPSWNQLTSAIFDFIKRNCPMVMKSKWQQASMKNHISKMLEGVK